MPSFLDIAPLAETVSVRGKDFPVRGIGIDDLARIIHRFPELGQLLPTALAPGTPATAVDATSIIALGPQLVASLIACATGVAGDDEEKAIAGLAIGEQLEFVEAIIRLSLPGGLNPFVETITRLLRGPSPASVGDGKVADMSLPSPSTS